MVIPGKEIFRHYDEYGLLRVTDDGNRRYLSFGEGDEQSCQLKAEPTVLQHDYTQAMLLVLLYNQPKNVVILGLGGGSLALTLQHHIAGLKLRVVELRYQVIKVAYRFFQLPRNKRMAVLNMDASEFLEDDTQSRTDIIFSDIYGAEGLDLQQTQPWFLQRCHELLKDDGWLVLNCWQEHRGEQAMLTCLREQFAEIYLCATAEGNWVVFAGKRPTSLSQSQLKQAAKKLSKQLGFSLLPSLSRLKFA